ncbi:MAG: DNA polymerase domain-containing protein [Halobacteria archaeon]
MKMRVTAVDYETEDEENVLIQLAGRDENGERKTLLVDGTTPYFYAPEDAEMPKGYDDDITGVEAGYESFDGKTIKQIRTRTPEQSGNLASEFEQTWESDIPYYRRATIDYGLSGHIDVPDKDRCHINEITTDLDIHGDDEINPRIFIADIEVLQGEADIDDLSESATNEITHITIWDSLEDVYICLALASEDAITPEQVDAHLREHAAAESLKEEIEKDIIIRQYETEESLLSGFLSLFEKRRPDLVSGWNFVDFDWDYILSRFEHLDALNEHRLSDIGYINGYQTERKVDCVPAFDMMDAYCEKMSFTQWRSQSLDYVAKETLGIGKIPDIDIDWCFENDNDLLTSYNIIDVMLCVALERKEDVHGFFYALAELSQIQVYDTFSEMRLVDGYLMSQAGEDEKLPPQEEKDIPENAGGLVLEPSDGVQEWVGVEDLKSLYPSVILTWNISPETIIWDEDTVNGPPKTPGGVISVPWLPDADHAEGGDFGHDEIDFDIMFTDMMEEGLIPKYIKPLFAERDEYKAARDEYDTDDDMYDVWDRKQFAIKVVMNSFYGVMSNDYWRLGKYGLGDAVTSAARFALWKGKEIAKDEGYDISYGDTDSIMVSLKEAGDKDDILQAGHALEDRLNERMDECVQDAGLKGAHPHLSDDLHGTHRHCLVYEFEKLYKRFFQAGSKKRYAGRIVWKEGKEVDGKIDTVGFESQRSDSPELTEEIQPEIINRILAGQEFQEVSDFLRDIIARIESRDIPLYRVALPSTLNKPLSEYGNTLTSRACRFGEKNLEQTWNSGDDPWVYFVRKTPPMTPSTDVIACGWGEDMPDGYELDLDRTLERALEGPLEPILQEVGWNFTELRNGAQTGSADDDSWADGDWETEDNEEKESNNKWL